MKRLFFILLFTCIARLIHGQIFLNLDFEYKSSRSEIPLKWYIPGNGYKKELDSIITKHGKNSLRIKSEGIFDRSFGVCTGTFPVDSVRNKKIIFSGWIKTESVMDGYAGLWWRVDGKEKELLGFDKMNKKGKK